MTATRIRTFPATSASRAAKVLGPLAIVGMCLVPVWLWTMTLPLEIRFGDAATSLRSLAVVCALAGVSCFAINLVLGARFKPVATFMGGLERMYLWHRINGRAAFLLLVSHGALIVLSQALISIESVGALFDPANGWTVILGLLALIAMAVAVWLTLYADLTHELFIYTQRSFGFIFLFAMLHVFRTPGAKASSAALTYYLVFLAACGIGAFLYRSVLHEILVPRRDFEVAGVNRLDESVIEITMKPRTKGIDYKPGQFVYMTFYSSAMRAIFRPFAVAPEGQSAAVTMRPGEVTRQFHPFSITSPPGGEHLSVAVKTLGDYTTAMRSLEPGAVARVEGPYGAFSYLTIASKRQIWIAGGIGVTPFLSMARSLRDTDYEIDFYYAANHKHQTYFMQELYEIADRNQRVRMTPIVHDELGRVTADDIAGLTDDLTTVDILICGPPAMIDSLTAQFIRKGVPLSRIHFERFGFRPRRRQRHQTPSR